MTKKRNDSFQTEFNRISKNISGYPYNGISKKSVKYKLAHLNHVILQARYATEEVCKIMENGTTPLGLSAAKILQEEGVENRRVIQALCKTMQFILSNDDITQCDYVLAQIIFALTSYGKHAKCAFPQIMGVAHISPLPSRIEYEIVRYAFTLADEFSDVKAFLDTLPHINKSYRESVAIYRARLSDSSFNWDDEIRKKYTFTRICETSFQYQFDEIQKLYTTHQNKSNQPTVQHELLGFKEEIKQGKISEKAVLACMQEGISPTALAAAEVLSRHGVYESEYVAHFISTLEHIIEKCDIVENSEVISTILGTLRFAGNDALKAFDIIKNLSGTHNLPADICDSIVRYAFSLAFHSADVFRFALSMKSHSDAEFRRVAKLIEEVYASPGWDWEAKVKSELSFRGIEICEVI